MVGRERDAKRARFCEDGSSTCCPKDPELGEGLSQYIMLTNSKASTEQLGGHFIILLVSR